MRQILLSATAGVVTDRILDLKRKWYKGRDKRTGLISGAGYGVFG